MENAYVPSLSGGPTHSVAAGSVARRKRRYEHWHGVRRW
jgi:hypothetical protein